jgi:hypothetical protein
MKPGVAVDRTLVDALYKLADEIKDQARAYAMGYGVNPFLAELAKRLVATKTVKI